MCERRTANVEQVVDSELDTRPHDPAQGSEVVKDNVFHQERVVRLNRRNTRHSRIHSSSVIAHTVRSTKMRQSSFEIIGFARTGRMGAVYTLEVACWVVLCKIHGSLGVHVDDLQSTKDVCQEESLLGCELKMLKIHNVNL